MTLSQLPDNWPEARPVLDERHANTVAAITACDRSLDTLLDEIQGLSDQYQESRQIISLLNQTVGSLDNSFVRMDRRIVRITKELKDLKDVPKPLLER